MNICRAADIENQGGIMIGKRSFYGIEGIVIMTVSKISGHFIFVLSIRGIVQFDVGIITSPPAALQLL